MLIIQSLILLISLLIWSLACGLIGFYYAKSKAPAKAQRPPSELSDTDIRRLKKSIQEYQNFLSYDGTEQENFND